MKTYDKKTKECKKNEEKKEINNAKSSRYMLKKRSWRWLKTWNIWELDGCDEDV